jgi:TonB family protein
MGYQALLFCPDEKTARTVTQVLGELEFSVEACLEPFAAVKKLMSQHFDAVVVDCDNEQNATLLFKSARNSTSNQASLAVAVVEGQAGVAKAFRIGANLVLTKPINIEQSKGTLRVARGLLRKGDPAKPGVPVATTPTPAAAPAKPAAPKPVAAAKPAATVKPGVSAAVAAPRPAVPPARPAAPAIPAKAAAANSVPVVRDRTEALPEISAKEPVAPPALDIPAPPPAPRPILGSHTASIDITSGFQPSSAAVAASYSSGAASAPAPAREVHDSHAPEISPASEANTVTEKHAEPVANDAPSFVGSAPSFTFGGANVPAESSGGRKKIFLGIAAAGLVVVGLYAGWSYFQGRATQPTSTPASTSTTTIPAPSAAPKPVNVEPKPAATTPSTSATSPVSKSAVQPTPADAAQPSASDSDEDNVSAPKSTVPAAGSTKPSSLAASPAGKPAKSESAPLTVKGGSAPVVHSKPAAPDTAAPNVLGLATPGSNAPPLNLGNGANNDPAPILQTLNISQGVSQGLLVRKVQPIYPKNALTMHVEGTVELQATVSTTGNITAVKVVSGDPQLTRAAADAVKQWKYKPYLLNGQPVEIQTEVSVNFKLPH